MKMTHSRVDGWVADAAFFFLLAMTALAMFNYVSIWVVLGCFLAYIVLGLLVACFLAKGQATQEEQPSKRKHSAEPGSLRR